MTGRPRNTKGHFDSNGKSLCLTYQQMLILHSLEMLIINDDIAASKDTDIRTMKRDWRDRWAARTTDTLRITAEAQKSFFMDEEAVRNHFNRIDDGPQQFLIILEALLFTPYCPLDENDDAKKLKKLTCSSKYLTNRFATLQNRVTAKDMEELQKSHRKATREISGATKKTVIAATGTAAAIAATGGLAAYFAPAIAVALAGGSAAATGLSGAALTSYSLAAIGGGSLAAGGLGMAGGTAIITGGGAILGTIGGTGISTATIKLMSHSGYVLDECSKLVTFCRTVLIGKYDEYDAVAGIRANVKAAIAAIKKNIDDYPVLTENDKKKEKEHKDTIKAARTSLKYLERCEKSLSDMLGEAKASENKATTAHSPDLPPASNAPALPQA